jgi:hypothetical protein
MNYLFRNPKYIYLSSLPFVFILFQNCSVQNFSGIDPVMKQTTLEEHSGLSSDSIGSDQFDNGRGMSGTVDNGLGGNSPNDNGESVNNRDSGLSNGNMMNDLGLNNGNNSQNNDGGLSPQMNLPLGIPISWNNPSLPSINEMNNQAPNQFQVGADPVTMPNQGIINVIRWCRKRDEGMTLKQTHSLIIKVKNKNETICQHTYNSNMIREIERTGRVQIPGCNFSSIPNKHMVVEVTDGNGKTLTDGAKKAKRQNAYNSFKIKAKTGKTNTELHALHLLLDRNVPKKQQHKECDAYNSSPLVVDMRTSAEMKQIFELTEPSQGVLFNVHGQNALPAADTPKQISWFKDPRIMPIVLPRNGQVFGIDQLFGDNTLGPDGHFADDGFAALRKYDGYNLETGEVANADGYITADDPIYSQLRLWFDRNRDGVATPNELISLERAGIEIIDLNYDPNFYSQDDYGNEIIYKSVVKFKDGTYKPVFDIWFAVNELIQSE